MSTFNRMPTWAQSYTVIMAVIALFSIIVFGGRILLNGSIFEHNPEYTQLVKIEETTQTASATGGAPQGEDLSGFIADPAKGKKLSAKCKACHTFDAGGKHRTGPNMWGIFGKGISEAEGFAYSKAFLDKKGEIIWNEQELNDFLAKPKKYIKGTKMAFGGIKKEKDRLNLIEWLKTLQ